jgi:hypothetical protein
MTLVEASGAESPAVAATASISGFVACDGLARIVASRPPSHRRAPRGRLHEPCACAIALPIGRASRRPRGFRPRLQREGRTAQGLYPTPGPRAGRAAYRPPQTSSLSPCDLPCAGQAHQVGRGRPYPSDQDATFQCALFASSKRNLSGKPAYELRMVARISSCRRGCRVAGVYDRLGAACVPEKERLRFPKLMRLHRPQWHEPPPSPPTSGAPPCKS